MIYRKSASVKPHSPSVFACDRAKYLFNNFNKIELHFLRSHISVKGYCSRSVALWTLKVAGSSLSSLSEGGSQRMSNLLQNCRNYLQRAADTGPFYFPNYSKIQTQKLPVTSKCRSQRKRRSKFKRRKSQCPSLALTQSPKGRRSKRLSKES